VLSCFSPRFIGQLPSPRDRLFSCLLAEEADPMREALIFLSGHWGKCCVLAFQSLWPEPPLSPFPGGTSLLSFFLPLRAPPPALERGPSNHCAASLFESLSFHVRCIPFRFLVQLCCRISVMSNFPFSAKSRVILPRSCCVSRTSCPLLPLSTFRASSPPPP